MVNIKRNLENLLFGIRIAAEEVCEEARKLGDDVKNTAEKVLGQNSRSSTIIDDRNDLVERQRQIIEEQREVQENLVIDNFRTLQMQRKQEELLLEQNRIIEEQRQELERLSKIHELKARNEKTQEIRKARIESQLENLRIKNMMIDMKKSSVTATRTVVAA